MVDRVVCLGILASFAMVFWPLSQVQFGGLAGIVAFVTTFTMLPGLLAD